jgi:hypothetical protein
MNRSMVIRMISESAIIVVSILVALSADAWLDTRRQDAQREGHLAALTRDFSQMSERIDASYEAANRAVQSGMLLLGKLQEDSELDPELVPIWLWNLHFYEVFSPSVGAYEALVAAGNIELLKDNELQRELAAFFGSFEDLRVSERLLVNSQSRFADSDLHGRFAGWHRLGMGGLPASGKAPFEQWSSSHEFMNAIGIITVRHIDVLEDYDFLRARIESIGTALAAQASDQVP